jgi:hypothetical protein
LLPTVISHPISNLRSNLSDTLAAARARASQYRSILSPAGSAGSGGTGRGSGGGVSFSTLGRRMAGLSTASLQDGEGGSGEFIVRAGGGPGPKNYSIFILSPELSDTLCLGSVNNGIKFCMASGKECTVGTHSKKVAVEHHHIYVNAGKGAAFSDPHVPTAYLEASILNAYLAELRPREDWLKIFQAILDDHQDDPDLKPLITPKKRKHRYLTCEDDPSPLSLMASWVPIDTSESLKFVLDKVQQVDQRLTEFQLRVGDDVDTLFARIQEAKASIGSFPVSLVTNECTTIWERLNLNFWKHVCLPIHLLSVVGPLIPKLMLLCLLNATCPASLIPFSTIL